MIGPIAAILVFIAAGLGLSAWSILRRASRGKAESVPDSMSGDNHHFAMGVEAQAEVPGEGSA
jgi:hypothetical protein